MDPAVFHFLNRDRHYTVESFIFVGPMFMDFQNFAGSWERHFVSYWNVALQCKKVYFFVKHAWDVN